MKNKSNKKPSTRQVVVQTAISIFLLILIGEMIFYSILLIAEEDDTVKYRQSDLNDGEYAECVWFYHMDERDGDAKKEGYELIGEFAEFYEAYILCVEYYESAEYLNEPSYKEQAREYYEEMMEISKNSNFPGNQPHYEYLLGTFQFEE